MGSAALSEAVKSIREWSMGEGRASATPVKAAELFGTLAFNDKAQQYKDKLPKDDPLANYRLSLAGGDADRGRKIFREKAEVQCLRCHKCEIGDSVVGPELTKIGALRDRFDVVLIDAPPLLAIGDGLTIAGFADAIVAVVRADFARRGVMHEFAATLESLPPAKLGFVVCGDAGLDDGYYGAQYGYAYANDRERAGK